MTEISRPWSGIVTGDAGPYSDDQWTDIFKTLLAHVVALQGVFRGQLDEFVLTSITPSPISIGTGRALVNGIWYESDAAETIAIPTPAANPRVDRIVLRADWTLQTVRLTRIAGAEAASPVPPALVQTDGVTWDTPLWQVRIENGTAVITGHRDEREYIGQYAPVEVTDQEVFHQTEMYTRVTLSNDDFFDHFVVVEVGASTVRQIQEAGFGSGGLEFDHDGIGTSDIAGIESSTYKPDIINARERMRIKVPNVDTNIDMVAGFVSSAASLTPADGVFFRRDGGLAGNWIGVCRAGGVETVTDTLQAAEDVWHEFEIRQFGTDVVQFLIDGAPVGTPIRTNIPSDIEMILAIEEFDDGSAPAAAIYMMVDYEKLNGDRPA